MEVQARITVLSFVSIPSSPVHLFFQPAHQMGQSKHYRFIMHIIQHIFICQSLQTGREFLVRLPESHDDQKERKKRQLIGHISSLQLFPANRFTGSGKLFRLTVKIIGSMLKEISSFFQITAQNSWKAVYIYPLSQKTAVFFGAAKHIVDSHRLIISRALLRPETILRPAHLTRLTADPIISVQA